MLRAAGRELGAVGSAQPGPRPGRGGRKSDRLLGDLTETNRVESQVRLDPDAHPNREYERGVPAKRQKLPT